MAESREASYARETVQPPKTALDRLSYADIAKGPLAVARALDKNPDAEKIASSILGKEPREHETNPMTLSENPDIREIQSKIYAELGIDTNTDANNPIKKLGKGVIDGLVIGNAEIVAKIQKDGMGEFLSNLKAQLTTLEGWQKIAEALGKSVLELFSGDAYKTGKSVAELGLITTGMGAAGSLVKMAGKQAVKASVKIGTETAAKEVATVAAYGAGKTLEKTGNALQVPAKTIAKVSEIAIAGMKKVGEVSGVNQVLKKGTEAIKDTIEAAGVSKVVEGTKNAVKRSLQGLSAVHIVGSAEGFPRHPKTAEAGAIFPEGRPTLTKDTLNEPTINIQERQKMSEELYRSHSTINTPEHREFLGQISPEKILGEGMNGIVVIHPTREGAVVKIAHPRAIHDLGVEASNHNTAFQLLRKGKQEDVIPDTVKIPRIIEHFSETKGYYVMEKMPGQSLHSRFLRETFASHFQKDPKELLDALTDNQLKRRLIDTHRVSAEYVDLAIENLSADYTRNYLANRADYQKAKEYLKSNDFVHPDIHGGNIMVDNNGNLYIIDFGDKPKP